MNAANPDLSVLIVNWNTRESLAECLRTLPQACGAIRWETIVVDNASSDGSPDMMLNQFQWVKAVFLNKNIGFGAAVNLAYRMARAPHVLLLNPDARPAKDSVELLLGHVRRAGKRAVVGGRLVGLDGTCQMADYYVPFPLLRSALLQYTRWLHRLLPRGGNREGEGGEGGVRQVPGACLMAAREAFDTVGPFDEDFFVWFEDVDWCYRAHRDGYELGVCREAVFAHEGGGSFEPLSVQTRKKMFYGNMLRFFRKHRGRLPWVALGAFMATEEAAVALAAGVIGLAAPWRPAMRSRSMRSLDFLIFVLGEMFAGSATDGGRLLRGAR